MQPKPVTREELAFGPRNVYEFLPEYDIIPEDFKRFGGNKWVNITEKWFFSGLPKGTSFKPKTGIDVQEALAHISACLRSWAPKHEHKTAGVAYLMSEWFEDVEIPS